MNEPEYIIEDAALVVYKNISQELQSKFSYDSIIEILDAMFEYLEEVNIASSKASIVDIPINIPAKLDENEMEYSIISRCARKDIFLTFEEVKTILNAEMLYLEQQGLIDEGDVGKYCN